MQEEEKPFLIFGMSPKRLVFLLVISLFILYVLTKLIVRFVKWIKTKRLAYLDSESYRFKQVVKALHRKNPNAFLNDLKIWVLKLDMQTNNFDSFLKHFGTKDLISEYSCLKNNLYKVSYKNAEVNYNKLSMALKESRKNYNMSFSFKKSKSSPFPFLIPSTPPKPSKCAFPIFVMKPCVGSQILLSISISFW